MEWAWQQVEEQMTYVGEVGTWAWLVVVLGLVEEVGQQLRGQEPAVLGQRAALQGQVRQRA